MRGRGINVEFIAANISHLRSMVLGIPAVFVDGRLMLYDPVTPDDVEAIVKGEVKGGLTVEEAISNFITGVTYNQALLSLVILHNSFKPLLADNELVEVLTRARLHGEHEVAREAAKVIASEDERLMGENRDRMLRALAYSLVRELYWLNIDPATINVDQASLWLLAKATVGRIGMQYPRPRVDRGTAEAIVKVLRDRGGEYLRRISEEQAEITSDAEFMSLFKQG